MATEPLDINAEIFEGDNGGHYATVTIGQTQVIVYEYITGEQEFTGEIVVEIDHGTEPVRLYHDAISEEWK